MKTVIKNIKLEKFRLNEGKDFLRVDCHTEQWGTATLEGMGIWEPRLAVAGYFTADGGGKSCKAWTQGQSWEQRTGSISGTSY